MFALIEPPHPLRAAVEAVISAAYLREHGARLAAFPRLLVAATDAAGISGAAALRFAEDGFFSERYLDAPIEQLITRHAGARTDRLEVAEVGHLAAARPGEIRALLRGIILHLQRQGLRWAFFTATARLRMLLRRTGIPLIELGAADPSRIGDATLWGRYYRQDPHVVAVGDHMLAPPLRVDFLTDAGRMHHA